MMFRLYLHRSALSNLPRFLCISSILSPADLISQAEACRKAVELAGGPDHIWEIQDDW